MRLGWSRLPSSYLLHGDAHTYASRLATPCTHGFFTAFRGRRWVRQHNGTRFACGDRRDASLMRRPARAPPSNCSMRSKSLGRPTGPTAAAGTPSRGNSSEKDEDAVTRTRSRRVTGRISTGCASHNELPTLAGRMQEPRHGATPPSSCCR